jgi:hypothetical protein
MSKLVVKSVYDNFYFISPGSWVFANKNKCTVNFLSRTLLCKDYTHEAILNRVWKTNKAKHCSYTSDVQYNSIKLSKLSLVLFVRSQNLSLVKNAKRYINHIEYKYGYKKTSMRICKFNNEHANNVVTLYLDGPSIYLKSPALLHWLIALIRTADYENKDIVPARKFSNTVQNFTKKDYSILEWATKRKIPEMLFKYHEELVEPIDFKKIYPKCVTNPEGYGVHSGFGLAALCSEKLYSKAYMKAIKSMAKKEKIKLDYNY